MISKEERLALFRAIFGEVKTLFDGLTAKIANVSDSLAVRINDLDARLRALPTPQKGDKGDPGESIKGDKGEPGERGEPGKDANPVDTAAIIADVLRQIPVPKDGTNGKDADPVDTQRLVDEILAKIPAPKDGKDVDMDAVRVQVQAEIAKAVGAIPAPKDGKDGQDGASVHPDTIRLMILDEVAKAAAHIPKAANGAPGRDALDIAILLSIDESKSYPRGTFARYRGGLIRAARHTDPAETFEKNWDVIIQGIQSIEVTQGDDLRTLSIRTVLTTGETGLFPFALPAMIHRDIYRANTDYKQGDVVTWDGSMWLCQVDTRSAPGKSSDWRLVVKRGRDGKDGEPPDSAPAVVRLK